MTPKDFSEKLKQQKANYEKEIKETNLLKEDYKKHSIEWEEKYVKISNELAQANLDIESLKKHKENTAFWQNRAEKHGKYLNLFKEEQRSNASNKRWKEQYKKELEATKIELAQKENIIKLERGANSALIESNINHVYIKSKYVHQVALAYTAATILALGHLVLIITSF